MAEGMVVKEQLTDAMIDAGAELTRKLDERGLSITAALWLFDPELGEWRLFFASPETGSKGPLAVYAVIHEAIDELGDKATAAPMSVIGLLGTEAELVRRLRTAFHTGQDVRRIRLKKSVADGHFVEDALIYRAAWRLDPTHARVFTRARTARELRTRVPQASVC